MVQSKFLKKEDFPSPQVMTIRTVAMEEVGKSDTRWVVYFNEHVKGIVLNVTKIRQLEATFGDDTDRWMGKRIKVMNDPTVMMGQQVVGGIKFIMPSVQQAQAAPMPPPTIVQQAAASTEFDDEIPF
jgi:hypothetical protein